MADSALQRQHDRAHGGRRGLHPGLRCGEPLAAGEAGKHGASGYTYDADGNRVKAVIGSDTTVYVGTIYEKKTSGSSTTITKYYQAGGQRIALRVNGVVRWLATDHLGSTALTVSETGGRLSEIRYKPWGESRGIPFGATPTQRRFTGQVLDEVAGGLYFYDEPALSFTVGEGLYAGNEWTPTGGRQTTVGIGFGGADLQLQQNQVMIGLVNPAGVGGGRIGTQFSAPGVRVLATSQAYLVEKGGADALGKDAFGRSAALEWEKWIPGGYIGSTWVSGARQAAAWANQWPIKVVP
ncbi:MAG: SLAP domain-containing protein [Anaerolineae bacterium]|nr:SLAP domain-containing protein [Anaerolineae bacterium]